MSIKIKYFVHGTTVDNENHISSGWGDAKLSDLGIKQSAELKNHINQKFDVVFCSDLSRAQDSARITFGKDTPIISDPRLRECSYGNYNGISSDIVEPLQEKAIEIPFENGESYEMVKARILEFLNSIKTDYDNKTIAIVAHKAPQLALDVLCKKMTWQQAFENDWRKVGKWQPGWDYIFE